MAVNEQELRRVLEDIFGPRRDQADDTLVPAIQELTERLDRLDVLTEEGELQRRIEASEKAYEASRRRVTREYRTLNRQIQKELLDSFEALVNGGVESFVESLRSGILSISNRNQRKQLQGLQSLILGQLGGNGVASLGGLLQQGVGAVFSSLSYSSGQQAAQANRGVSRGQRNL